MKKEPLRIRLSKTKTAPEIEAMIREIENDPDSKIGAIGLNILNKAAIRKLDEMTWALYYLSGHAQKEVGAASDIERKLC